MSRLAVRSVRHSSSLPVIDAVSSALIDTLAKYAANPANTAHVGILLLQPVTGQVSGATFNTGAVPEIVSGNLNASCDQDPAEFAFGDWQIVDGVRASFLAAWPATDSGLATSHGRSRGDVAQSPDLYHLQCGTGARPGRSPALGHAGCATGVSRFRHELEAAMARSRVGGADRRTAALPLRPASSLRFPIGLARHSAGAPCAIQRTAFRVRGADRLGAGLRVSAALWPAAGRIHRLQEPRGPLVPIQLDTDRWAGASGGSGTGVAGRA